MAGESKILADDSLISRLDRGFLKLEQFLALLSGLAAFSLMFLAVYSVGGRKFFNSPLSGYVDWIEQIMPLIAVMGISWVQREGGHIRMDLLIGRLKGRLLWAAELVSVTLIFFLMISLVYGSWTHFERSFDFSSPLWSRDSSIDIGLPVWPAKILVPIAFSTICIRLVLQIWAYGCAFVRNTESPVAIPLKLDIAEQAAVEADQLKGRD